MSQLKQFAFQKWEATGNDFFFIDSVSESVTAEDLAVDEIRAICDRSSGDGADGVVFFTRDSDLTAEMTIVNSDGSRGDMCGNALRCLSRILAEDGHSRHRVKLSQRSVTVVAEESETGSVVMGTAGPEGERPIFDGLCELDEIMGGKGYLLSFGNPHYVVPYPSIPKNWEELGALCQPVAHRLLQTGGINCGFLQTVSVGESNPLRVFERGAGATKSCGSGACAASAVLEFLGLQEPPHRLTLTGGDLVISRTGGEFVLSGPVRKEYEGVWKR